MGQHAWLLLATVATELLLIFKWGRGQFPAPFPVAVKICASVAVVLLVAYPAVKVSNTNSCLYPFDGGWR
jgi:phosphatidylserine synthase 2